MATRSARDRPAEFWIAVIGCVAGVIGAAAAVAVFVIPAATGEDPSPPPTTGETTPPPTTPASTLSTEASTDVRYLVDLKPSAGAGFLETTGQDLSISCPTNQSDDVEHEVTYTLPTEYTQLTTDMTVGGEADAEATASLQLFVQRRVDRNDAQTQAGDALVLKQGARGAFTRPLGGATTLTLRVRCTSRDQVVKLAGPRVTR
ncbi:hypothetical protein [Kineosporia succinea]|uniref:Ribosomally synthesized peptide with SipW-like signal peptide n=1 Tax=Kineosporia succinea TaxID=84632 RepID=A0ABT9P8V3_9ACTN|nr:hypothetical protein [Kineosporia succinea]MDP9828455.1 hypothetical protein [Kineosporia succinea]